MDIDTPGPVGIGLKSDGDEDADLAPEATKEQVAAHLALRTSNLQQFLRAGTYKGLDSFHHVVHGSKGLQQSETFKPLYAIITKAICPDKKVKECLKVITTRQLHTILDHAYNVGVPEENMPPLREKLHEMIRTSPHHPVLELLRLWAEEFIPLVREWDCVSKLSDRRNKISDDGKGTGRESSVQMFDRMVEMLPLLLKLYKTLGNKMYVKGVYLYAATLWRLKRKKSRLYLHARRNLQGDYCEPIEV